MCYKGFDINVWDLNKNKHDSSDVHFVFIEVYNLIRQNGGIECGNKRN